MPEQKKSKAPGKWRPAPEELIAKFDLALQAFPAAEKRKMFGYPCAFANGQLFTGLHQENMIMRLSENDRTEFLKTYGTGLFEPMPGRPMREYVLVPSSMLESMSLLTTWLERSFRYATSIPPKAAKSKSPKKGKSK